jgi:hypothetical protein
MLDLESRRAAIDPITRATVDALLAVRSGHGSSDAI